MDMFSRQATSWIFWEEELWFLWCRIPDQCLDHQSNPELEAEEIFLLLGQIFPESSFQNLLHFFLWAVLLFFITLFHVSSSNLQRTLALLVAFSYLTTHLSEVPHHKICDVLDRCTDHVQDVSWSDWFEKQVPWKIVCDFLTSFQRSNWWKIPGKTSWKRFGLPCRDLGLDQGPLIRMADNRCLDSWLTPGAVLWRFSARTWVLDSCLQLFIANVVTGVVTLPWRCRYRWLDLPQSSNCTRQQGIQRVNVRLPCVLSGYCVEAMGQVREIRALLAGNRALPVVRNEFVWAPCTSHYIFQFEEQFFPYL